jgi:transposase
MSERQRRRKFSREFKQEAVRLVQEGKRRSGEVAQELGINKNLLYRWRREYAQDEKESFRGSGHRTEAEEQLRQAYRENEILREERDILKKALAIVSKAGK